MVLIGTVIAVSNRLTSLELILGGKSAVEAIKIGGRM